MPLDLLSGEQGWRSDECTRRPQMWLGVFADSKTNTSNSNSFWIRGPQVGYCVSLLQIKVIIIVIIIIIIIIVIVRASFNWVS